MKKGLVLVIGLLIAVFVISTVSYAADNQTAGEKFKNFWNKLFGYPAKVTEKSVGVVTDTAVKTTQVVTNEVKTVGQVTSGDVKKTQDLVVEPLKGTAETAKSAVEGTVKVPVDAAKEVAAPAAAN